MGIQLQGNGGAIAEVDGTTFRAVRFTPRPVDHTSFGQYRVSSIIALAASQTANGSLLSFRWGDATRLAVIQYVRLQCLQTAAATATIWPSFEVFIARAFSVSDSGGTALTLTGNSFKKRTSMGTTLVTDLRVSGGSAGLTAGTRTLDGNAILQLPTTQVITTPGVINYQAEWSATSGGFEHPEVLAQNEGLIVRGPTTVFGAAGTANLVVEIAWAEVAAY